MTTIIINERTAKGKSLVNFLKKFEGESFINFESPANKTPNKVTAKAIKEAKEGKNINRYNSADELFNKLGI